MWRPSFGRDRVSLTLITIYGVLPSLQVQAQGSTLAAREAVAQSQVGDLAWGAVAGLPGEKLEAF